MRHVVLLGPQRFAPSVAEALAAVGCTGAVAVVTAGWQEREEEIGELRTHLRREVHNLELYRRADAALAEDPELAEALRRRQEELQRVQELYRLRLRLAVRAVRELLRQRDGDALRAHRRAALQAVRLLDRQHVAHVARYHEEFDSRWSPARRPAVARQREELARLLSRVSALAIAGGHVAVLLNRMRLLDVLELGRRLPLVAWSAGAMVLAEQVVLFHDDPPQGEGSVEVLEAGFGLCPRIVPLPHAEQRLRLGNPTRVALLARRFAPAVCVPLQGGTRLDWDGRRWHPAPGTRCLGPRGELAELESF